MSPTDDETDSLFRLERLVPLCESIRKGTEYGAALSQATSLVLAAATLPGRAEGLLPAVRALRGTQHIAAREILADLEKLEAAGSALERCVNVDALKDARFSVKEIQESLQRIETQVAKAWATRVQAEFGPVQGLGAVLAEIPDTKTVGVELQTWAIRTIKTATGVGTPSATSVTYFDLAQAERAERLETLGKLGIDAAVSSFLLAVANKRASLASITPPVLEWLRAKNAQARFRIELL